MARKKRKKRVKDRETQKKQFSLPNVEPLRKYSPFIIAIIAFLIRMIPYRLKRPIGYDPYFHLAYLEYITEHGWVNYFPYALGPWGFLINHFHPKGMWITPYLLSKAGLPVYDSFKLAPPLFGSLTILTTYYFIRRLYGWREAVLSSLFLTFSFGHVFRSMANYYRGDNHALFWYSLVLLILAYAITEKNSRKKAYLYLLSGLAIGLSSAFWSAYYVVLALPLLSAVFLGIYSSLTGEKPLDAVYISLSSLIGAIIASLGGRVWNFGMFWTQNWQGSELARQIGIPTGPIEDVYLALHILVLVPLTLAFIVVAWFISTRIPSPSRKPMAIGLSVVFLLAGILAWWKYGSALQVFASGLSSFGGSITAEMSRPSIHDLNLAYSVSLLLLIGYPLSLINQRKGDVLVLSAVLPLTIMALYWTRFLFFGSLGIALGAGIGGSQIITTLSKVNARKAGVALVLLVLLISAYHTTTLTYDVRPIAGDEWESALTHLRQISNENDIVLTWWDHGHWVTYFAHRAAVAQGTPSREVARFYLGNLSKEYLLEHGVDYVTVSFDTIAKWGSVLETAGYRGKGYVLIITYPAGKYGETLLFSKGSYQVAVEVGEKNESWNVAVNAGGATFVPEEVWVEKGGEIFRVIPQGERAGNAYLYVNLNYGYAVIMDRKTRESILGRLMFTAEYPPNYELVYSDGGLVKIFRLKHPNVELNRENGLTLEFINATGDYLRIYGYTDSGERIFYKVYNVTGLTKFHIPDEVKGDVIRYTYLKGDEILDRGVFRRSDGWS